VCVCLSVRPYSHNSRLGGRRQKPIGELNSSGIGEGAKQNKKFEEKQFENKIIFFLARSRKSSKMGENEYNLKGEGWMGRGGEGSGGGDGFG
jgi:hypothetical protein